MNNFREWLSDNLRYIILGAVIIVVVLVIFFGVRLVSGLFDKGSADSTKTEEQASDNTDNESGGTDNTQGNTVEPEVQVDTTLVENTNDDVAALVNKYYVAMGAKDVESVKACVDNLSTEDEKLITDPLYIEGFSDVKTYTVPGMEEGSYIAYVSYNMKLKNIETLYPAINQNYISTNTDGAMYIVTGNLSAEQQAYVDQIGTQEDVQNLISSVEQAEETAEAADAALANFIRELGFSTSSAMDAADGTMVVVATSCNVRTEPSADSEALGTVAAGEQYTKTGISDEWVQIDYNGEPGYIRGDLLE
ncbi:MAG: SH3 domain-containing protein [Lachnospiraceae bacterium]|nr:SH3 domain-containing protein [Lachnospiraceae bacterium]MDD3616777.1 SH3 domain-containing protein [Lachnospiraceae bacterium]